MLTTSLSPDAKRPVHSAPGRSYGFGPESPPAKCSSTRSNRGAGDRDARERVDLLATVIAIDLKS